MNHVSGANTAVGVVETEAGGQQGSDGKRGRIGGARVRGLLGVGLFVAMVGGFAGCHKTPAQDAVTQNAGDPADANMAPVDGGGAYAPAPPARALGQNVQYQVQQQGEEYGPQQGAPIERRAPYTGDPNNYDQQADNQQAVNLYQNDLADAEADEAPPPLPYYEQPPAPDPDYLWTPGYWAWGPGGYYWVPGCWVAAPYTGALWTPGYWGFVGTRYRFHHGFWGLHIGFYGGIDYGYGYTGHGYYGGYWDHDHFRYNTAVNRVNENVIRNVYVRNVVVNNVVVNNRIINRVSFNGGRGGVDARPLAAEVAVLHEQRNAPMASQMQVQRDAAQNKQQFYRQNQGRPGMLANARPVVADRAPSAALPKVAAPMAQPGGRGADNRPGQMQGPARPGQAQPGQQPLQGRPAQPDNRGFQPDARGQVQPQPDSRLRQVQPQPDNRGVQPNGRGQVQPQPDVRQAQPQPDTRGLRQAQPQPQPQFRQVQPAPEVRQPQPQPRPQEQARPQLQPRPQEQVRPQPQPRPQEQARPQPTPPPEPAPRAQPEQHPQPQPAPSHQPQQQNDSHKNDRNPNR
jgi:hypothetical protein